ncbi:beta-ketoacyl-ACP synthase II [Reinekea marina]|uniref:3-oxoacyl-[acyl-carrier-protein] synthase 2 n=1 Tax=Reinekea marina TaxID=1310421 RepID=A0ABV7WPV4_9GAMM|nr:beta-ketoacyl-ACP synthase II [Reinekea marina]MDN3649519.1 beta-ketoacyl-ACP synthase II [Reinekea marina]
MTKRRVVVTGMGCISPLGNTVKDTWDGILAGKSGVNLIENFDTEKFTTKFAAQVKNFDPSDYMNSKDTKKMDGFIQYGIAAAVEAIADSGIEVTDSNASRMGVAIGSGIGGLDTIETNFLAMQKSGPRRMSPFFVPAAIINMISGNLSIQYGFKGPNIAITTACTTGTHNIGYSARTIAYGDADVMIAGGAEMASGRLGMGGFGAARALSTRNDDPTSASRPWDVDRDGFVLGDGAAVLVLEEYEHAKARGAQIYAEMTGFGMSGDAYHMTSPPEDGSGAAASMQNALNDAKLNAVDINYINAHGTSTPAGDVAESQAAKSIYGADSDKIVVSSTKSMVGHLLGAAGAIEAVFSVLAIRDQVAPPTINLDNPDPRCDLDYVPHTARNMEINHALSNSFGFGGTNGSLIFSKI